MDGTDEGNVVRATSAPLDDIIRPHVAVIYSSEMTCHRPLLEEHYEQPARITRIWETITAAGCTLKMKRIPIRPAHKMKFYSFIAKITGIAYRLYEVGSFVVQSADVIFSFCRPHRRENTRNSPILRLAIPLCHAGNYTGRPSELWRCNRGLPRRC